MNIILHDLSNHLTFAPLTLTRPVGKLRMGMWTNDERWKFYFPAATVSFSTETYLSTKYPCRKEKDTIWVNAAVIPTPSLTPLINDLNRDESLYVNDTFVACRGEAFFTTKKRKVQLDDLIVIKHRWDMFKKNDQVLRSDFNAYTKGKKSQPLSKTNTLIGDETQLFIEKGALVECAVLNVKTGPIYIGKDVQIMENTAVRGGLAMAQNSVLKLSTKVYGTTSIGEYCKVGGEVNNVIFQAYSNKGHDGFIGNSLIGEWCNLGAATNCSNLKNNYGEIKTYDFEDKKMVQTNEQFMGVTMGDYSKTSINTNINTGTVIGVSAMIFMAGFPPKNVDDFSWGGNKNNPVYTIDKAVDAVKRMMLRRKINFTDEDLSILTHLHDKRTQNSKEK